MISTIQYTVIGAGNGGKAVAAHLALMGFPVSLYYRTPENIQVIKARGGIALSSYKGGPQGFGELRMVTSEIREVTVEADIIMVVTPSTARSNIAQLLSGHLQDGQIIILIPGRTGGVLRFSQVLRAN